MLLDGPINAIKFRTYVEKAPAPTLKPGDIVIIDNLGGHKGQAIRTAIRKAAAQTESGIRVALAHILGSFTQAEGATYLRHAGYASR